MTEQEELTLQRFAALVKGYDKGVPRLAWMYLYLIENVHNRHIRGERLVSPPLLIGLRRRSWPGRWARVSTPKGGHSVARIDGLLPWRYAATAA